jgi:hypothetical protein
MTLHKFLGVSGEELRVKIGLAGLRPSWSFRRRGSLL